MASTQPQTISQAINFLESKLTVEDLELLRNAASEDLIDHHLGVAAYIRGTFNLWSMNSALQKEFPGIHPDDISMAVMEQLWKKLNGL